MSFVLKMEQYKLAVALAKSFGIPCADCFVQTAVGALTLILAVKIVGFITKTRPNSYDRYYIQAPLDKSKFKHLGNDKDPQLEELGDVVQEMRESFESGYSRPLSKRIEQLKALRRLFVENEKELIAAIQADLGRPEFEATFYDLLIPLHDLDTMIKNLPEWTLPEKKGFSLLSFPSQDLIYQEPLGVVLVIGTWNYPIMLTLLPLLGAIAAGNTVILKPCMVSKNVAHLLRKLIPKYMDPYIVKVVGTNFSGDRQCTGELLKSKFDHIFFTGSPSVGKVIAKAAAEYLTPCTLELGGKNPVFVAADADLDLAAKRAVWGRMMNAGQQCIAPDYCLVEESVVEQFNQKCAYYIKTLYSEDPKKAQSIGRIVGDSQMQRLEGVLKATKGKFVYGGDFNKSERYIAPSVLHCPVGDKALEEETFGPILLVVTVKNMREAISYVRARPKPLSLYIFSSSKTTQELIIHNTSAGGVTVNATLFHAGHPDLPFGGVGESGMGAYHGKATFTTFSHPKPVVKKSVWFDGGLLSDPFFLYPPWSNFKIKLIRMLMKIA
eukprot:Colp12_sorted_trinity150504_noHs@10561